MPIASLKPNLIRSSLSKSDEEVILMREDESFVG